MKAFFVRDGEEFLGRLKKELKDSDIPKKSIYIHWAKEYLKAGREVVVEFSVDPYGIRTDRSVSGLNVFLRGLDFSPLNVVGREYYEGNDAIDVAIPRLNQLFQFLTMLGFDYNKECRQNKMLDGHPLEDVTIFITNKLPADLAEQVLRAVQ